MRLRVFWISAALAGVLAGAAAASDGGHSSSPALEPNESFQMARAVPAAVPAALNRPHRQRRDLNLREMSLPDLLTMLTREPNRRAGSEYGKRTETFLANAFQALGCSVTRQEVPVHDWQASETSLCIDDVPVVCSPMPFSPFADRAMGRLVYVPDAAALRDTDVRGAIVVTDQRFPVQPLDELWSRRLAGTTAARPAESELAWGLSAPGITPIRACEAGAVGLVNILIDHVANNASRYWPYQGPLSGVPAVYVSRAEGERLKAAAARGATATLRLTGSLTRCFSQNIVAELTGSSSRVYLFQAHHDSPYNGAVDDAGSLVALIELARHYSALPEHRRPGRMVFACTTGHFDGAIGVRMLAREILPQWRYRYRAVFSFEQVGARDVRVENGRLVPLDATVRHDVFVPDNDRLRAAVTAALEDARLPNVLVLPDRTDVYPLPPGEGSTITGVGIPTIQFTSAPPYLLTEEDRPDKVDFAMIERHVDLVIDIIRRLG